MELAAFFLMSSFSLLIFGGPEPLWLCGLSLRAVSLGHSLVAGHRLLIAVASLVVDHGL